MFVTVHIFQIGCRDFGRYGFEKIVDKERFFPEDVIFEAICEKDFEHSERAESFAEAAGSEIDFYNNVDDIYDAAQKVDGTVLIYDAGPVSKHGDHIERSLRNDFFHLAEKPPSLSRDEHISERKLAAKHDVHFKVDFIERESPVVKKSLEIVDKNQIESIEVFRESSAGVRRMLQPVKQAHVNEGCTLDKMVHDIYVMDFLKNNDLELEQVEDTVFMPKDIGSEKFLHIDGSVSNNISKDNSLAQVKSSFTSGSVDVDLNASWIGVSDEAKIQSQEIRKIFSEELVNSGYSEIDDTGFLDEEARFFVIEADRKIVGDLLNNKMYDLTHEKRIEVEKYPRDQLYRVLEKTVVDAAGGEVEDISEAEIDGFMNALFDVQDLAGETDIEAFDALDEASGRMRSMLVSDKTELDKDDLKGVAS